MAESAIYPQSPTNGAQILTGENTIKYTVALGSELGMKMPFIRIDNGQNQFPEYTQTAGGGIVEITTKVNVGYEYDCHALTMGVIDGDVEYSETIYVNVGYGPHIRILLPEEGTISKDGTVHLEYLAMAMNGGVESNSNRYFIDGAAYQSAIPSEYLENGYLYKMDLILSPGEHTISVKIQSKESTPTEATDTVNVKVNDIQVILETPENNATVYSPVHIAFKAKPLSGGVGVNPSKADISIDGGYPAIPSKITELPDGIRFEADRDIEEGEHKIIVGAYDKKGSIVTEQSTIIVASEPLQFEVREQSGTTASKSCVLTMGSNKNCQAEIRVNGRHVATIELQKGKVVTEKVSLIKGKNLINVTATDGVSTVNKYIEITCTPYIPEIKNVRVEPNVVEAGQEYTVTVEVDYHVSVENGE